MIINTKNKELLGKIFMGLSVIMLVYMLITPLSHTIFHVDEYFTITVLNFPLMDLINVTAHDVHPPFYYLLLKLFADILAVLGMESIKVFIFKLVSLAPYAIIMLVSFTKLRDEYGYLTAGLFPFSLAVMGEFFVNFLTIRMYGWAILFVVLAFIYLKDVFYTNDTKPWIILTILSVLGAYTHYFAAISLGCIYLMLLIYILLNDKAKLKYWAISVVAAAVLYIPWVFAMMGQISTVGGGFWIPEITFDRMIDFLGYFAEVENGLFSLIAIAMIIFFVHTYKKSKGIDRFDNFYLLTGIMVFLGTIIIGTAISILFKPILINRYLLPSAAVLWLVISIMISKFDNQRDFLISFAIIAVLLLAGAGHLISTTDSLYHNSLDDNGFFSEIINDDNSMLILNLDTYRMFFFEFANKTDMYVVNEPDNILGESLEQIGHTFNFKEVSKDDIPKVIHENNGKNIYMLSYDDYDVGGNITMDRLFEDSRVVYSKIY